MGRLLRSTPTNIIGDNYTTTAVEGADDWVVAIEKAEYIRFLPEKALVIQPALTRRSVDLRWRG